MKSVYVVVNKITGTTKVFSSVVKANRYIDHMLEGLRPIEGRAITKDYGQHGCRRVYVPRPGKADILMWNVYAEKHEVF